MGGQASTNLFKSNTELNQVAINKCGVTANQSIKIKNFSFKCPDSCIASGEKCDVNIGNAQTIDASCAIGAQQDSLATLIASLGAEAQAGLGFSASTNKVEINKQISQIIQSTCQDASDQSIDVSETQLETCGNLTFQNNATVKTKCEMGAIQKLVDQTKSKVTSSASGWDPTTAMVAFVIIAIIAYVGYSEFKKAGKSIVGLGFGRRHKSRSPPQWVFKKRH